MNKKILYSIIGLVLVGGLFSAVYAGPIINTITFAGLTIFKENAQFDKDVNIDGIVTGQAITDFQNQIDNNEARITDIELFLEERSDFWEFLEESGEEFFESQIYEVSAVSLVPVAGGTPHIGNDVQLRCLDGDWFLIKDPQKPVSLSFPASIVLDEEQLISRGVIIEAVPRNTGIADGYSKNIGWDGFAEQIRGFQSVDIPVTISGLCASPSP